MKKPLTCGNVESDRKLEKLHGREVDEEGSN